MIYAVIDTNVFVVALEKRDDDSYLVTGNQKHYPVRDDGHFESINQEPVDDFSSHYWLFFFALILVISISSFLSGSANFWK